MWHSYLTNDPKNSWGFYYEKQTFRRGSMYSKREKRWKFSYTSTLLLLWTST